MPASAKTKQKKQCSKGWSCGYSCIRKGAQCRNPLEKQATGYANWMAGGHKAAKSDAVEPVLTKPQPVSQPQKTTATDLAKKIAPNNPILLGIARDQDEAAPLSDFLKARMQAAADHERQVEQARGSEGFFDAKLQQAKKLYPNLTEEEAIALAAYVHAARYAEINANLRSPVKLLKDKDQKTWVEFPPSVNSISLKNERHLIPLDYSSKSDSYSTEMRNKLIEPTVQVWAVSRALNNALFKIPPINFEQLKSDNPKLEANHPLKRHIAVDDLKGFLNRYSPGKQVIETAFTSTTSTQTRSGCFADTANVELQIHYKKDGTSRGRYVDKVERVKHGTKEREVVFPPLTAFKVREITQERGRTIVVMDEE
jgi:hypothetical protein